VYALTRTFAPRAAAALAALLMAAYPFAVYTATTFYPQTMAAALVPLSLLALVRATETEGRRRLLWASAAGAGLAATTLTVPTFAYLAPLALVWLAFARRQALVSIGAPIIVVVVLVIGAWTVRNALTMNAFVPLASSSGYNLLVGNHPGANATTGSEPRVMNPYLRAARRRDLSELEANGFFARIARNWISRHKAEAAKLYLAKVANNFNWTNTLATKGVNTPLMSLIGAVTYLPLLALLVLRLALWRRFPLSAPEKLMVAVMLANALLLAIYTTRVRYRVPVDTLMVSIVAGFLVAALAPSSRAPSAAARKART
jgi:4-amino-4-deoxy-L-arabinose transferase-like glycosyltransferase